MEPWAPMNRDRMDFLFLNVVHFLDHLVTVIDATVALLTGYVVDNGGWRMGLIIPGCFSIAMGAAYALARRAEIFAENGTAAAGGTAQAVGYSALFLRVSLIVFMTTTISSIIFQ